MKRASALFLAMLLGAAIVRALFKGDAAIIKGLRREEEPLSYWGIIMVAAAVLAWMLIIGEG